MYTQGLISVIVPVYNVAEYLPRCMDSIIRNTYKNLQIICVNDGSTDQSLDILQHYAQLDSRITIINKTNGGLSSARNTGLKEAIGEYIAYIDSDDWIHTQYFEFLYRAAKEQHADMAICDYIRTTDENVLAKDVHFHVVAMSVNQMFSSFSTKAYVWRRLYKRTVVDQILFDESEKMEDSVYNTDVIRKKHDLNIVYVDAIMYAYFIRANSLASRIQEDDVLKLSKRLLIYAQEESNPYVKELMATECIKRTLSSRNSYILQNNSLKKAECNHIIREVLNYIKSDKCKYWFLYKFSFVYKYYRVITDPTMLTYAKQQRKLNDI